MSVSAVIHQLFAYKTGDAYRVVTAGEATMTEYSFDQKATETVAIGDLNLTELFLDAHHTKTIHSIAFLQMGDRFIAISVGDGVSWPANTRRRLLEFGNHYLSIARSFAGYCWLRQGAAFSSGR